MIKYYGLVMFGVVKIITFSVPCALLISHFARYCCKPGRVLW